MKPEIRVFNTLDELSIAAAEEFVRIAADSIAGKKRFTVALAGGSTPRTLYSLLASQYCDQIRWDRVHIFWGDERYVPSNDPQSNYKMVRDLLLIHAPIPPQNINRVPTHFRDPQNAARAYESMLHSHFQNNIPEFDLILLGLGNDGHTASLFPGSLALLDQEHWVVSVETPRTVLPSQRLTLTLPVINRARNIFFLVAGNDKHKALHAILHEPEKVINLYAAAMVSPKGTLIWFVDRAAAG